MKKLFVLILGIVFLTGCAVVKSPVTGLIYSDVKAPFAVTSNTGADKVGTAQAKSILGIVGIGDASIETAAKSAGITRIHHVDEHITGILGIYATYTVVVYGE
jgi:hypothetical protein